ncbi:hypothetical protein N7510_002599 [Penicillium lagena]|uniref:uncharacterized protein n=1 Tax=Penicillium lagena TaxID=94218 RepID=UPI0025401106|nr:uncharacterized protein N7510_002599 [Penicillium lagena]KAJ5626290.1 hypothetical protein N7510_002599 [Penicillium lagena]
MSSLASQPIQADDLVNPGNSSACSSTHTTHGTPPDMKDWTMNGAESLDQAISSSKPDSPAVQMLAFSMSQQLMTPTVGPNDVMFPEMTDFPAVQDPNDRSDMSQDLKYSYMDFLRVILTYTVAPQMIPTPMGTISFHLAFSNLSQSLPPLTEASNDVSVTSSCSHTGFSSFMATDDVLLGDFTSIGNQGVNPMDPLFPSTALTDRDPNNKYLDSHLKPYRCKVDVCVEAQLRFSSNACLFRHEREAHGLHGHGDNPNLCLWEGCERSVPGYGFPRRWNLFDHMRRVHDYTISERPSSPEAPPVSTTIKRKEPAGRKKRITGATPGQTMKRTRSVHSQASSLKATQSSAHHGHRLQNAERSYYNCRSRLLEELDRITPQNITMHDKVNASLQELFTLGLNYRHIEASHTMPQPTNRSPSA